MDRRHRCNSVVALAWLLLIHAHPATAAGDAVRGAPQFQACMACHGPSPDRAESRPCLGKQGRHRPRLSTLLRRAEKSDIVWNEETLDKWLRGPAGFVPGTGMAFPGIKDTSARQDLIAYLRAVSEGKAPKPPASGMGMMLGGSKSNL